MSKDGGRRTPWLLTALTWWTFAGTCVSAVGLFTDVPRSGLLWPTEIQPHGLGLGIGAVVLVALLGISGAMRGRSENREPDATDR